MHLGMTLKKFLTVSVILVAYIVTLVLGGTEVRRRSLQLGSPAEGGEYVAITINVTSADYSGQELSTLLSFRLAGAIASDAVTPAVDLKLYVNNVRGQQEFQFPKGQRINPVEVSFPMSGNRNNYPFDRYRSVLSLLMTRPAAGGEAKSSQELPTAITDTGTIGQLPIGTVALKKTSPIPLSVALFADVPGIKFNGNVDRQKGAQLTEVNLHMRRADNLIMVSILIMTTMIGLAVTLMFILLRLISEPKATSDIGLASMSFALIFGLPALRNAQPGVPPIGAFCDYISFIWAELTVAVAGMVFAWSWLRAMKRKRS